MLVVRSFPKQHTKNSFIKYFPIDDTMIRLYIDFYLFNKTINFKINVNTLREITKETKEKTRKEIFSEDNNYSLKFEISDPQEQFYINNFQMFVFKKNKRFEIIIDSISNYNFRKEFEKEFEKDFVEKDFDEDPVEDLIEEIPELEFYHNLPFDVSE